MLLVRLVIWRRSCQQIKLTVTPRNEIYAYRVDRIPTCFLIFESIQSLRPFFFNKFKKNEFIRVGHESTSVMATKLYNI